MKNIWVKRFLKLFALLGALFALIAVVLLSLAWSAMGKGMSASEKEIASQSKQYKDGAFENPDPLWNDFFGMMSQVPGDDATPKVALETAKNTQSILSQNNDDLRVTWLGHSTLFIEIEGVKILTDPVWGERTSPISFIGPKRWYAPLVELDELPKPDAVLISHDHYDHLDAPTLKRMASWKTHFYVPLGVGSHLRYWGVPKENISEFDWWQETQIKGLRLVCTPARHASGRQLFDQNKTLWSGWAMLGQKRRVYFSGDTGMFMGLNDIGEKLGPFDVAMIEVGAYNQAWPDWHIGPEQAVDASKMLKAKSFLPIHWGLFNLASHNWTEPIERVRIAAKEKNVHVWYPKPGESIGGEDFDAPSKVAVQWWPKLPFRTAAEDPIVSTRTPARPKAPE